ncbi:DeoR/GlpR family DNA-binding transcription regulator [Pseudonocardia endophytica]|uniref:Lactose phosphotransferase system repressor n=1 Tax=Pseudonocardia endophytica TaxID=401976 RepID=A0A4R1HJ88_PSEEN|nr:DeoR/GlpR family DNA-binding transcription regulator [Pseudonocardia endophytica]TCK22357.1 DeoR family transcriptional regulator [Pseudonocardia endophytica]
MRPEKRREVILARARAVGRVDVVPLSDELEVTTDTVRRDLQALESHGLLRRTQGGAYPVETTAYESSMDRRSQTNVPMKRRIAAEAVAWLQDAESVFVDEGFTPLLIAEELLRLERPLVIVTASVPVISLVSENPQVTPMLLGGQVRGRTMGAVGPWTTRTLERLVIDVAYLGANGVSADYGMTTPDPAVAAVKAQAVASSRRRVFIGTHTKFGVSSFHKFADVRDFEVLVTDSALSSAEADRYAANGGPKVVRV